MRDVPYYILDGEGNSQEITTKGEAYIDDNDLRDLLVDLLGDDVSEEEIKKILDAASNKDMSEEEFDKLVDDFILNSKK